MTTGIKSMPIADGKTALIRECPWCKKEHSITVEQDDLANGIERLANGALIQDAFPTFTSSQREFLMTGICDKCWNSM